MKSVYGVIYGYIYGDEHIEVSDNIYENYQDALEFAIRHNITNNNFLIKDKNFDYFEECRQRSRKWKNFSDREIAFAIAITSIDDKPPIHGFCAVKKFDFIECRD